MEASKSLLSVAALLALLLVCSPRVTAQGLPLDAVIPTPGVTYDASIPLPDSVIGTRMGHRHMRPDEVVTFFERVAAASPRVLLREHGRSHQGRRLQHAIISHPDNLARIDEIQAAQLRSLVDPEAASTGPVVVWMGYGVHGNESSAHEAAVMLLYYLAAGRGGPVEEMMRDLVVVIDPNMNPDGHDRFVDWVNGQRGLQATADSQDREHRSPWPSGRTNHYLFDLNRDWLLAVNPESQARLKVWHGWRPHLHTDFHEMGGERTYFFQPGIPSRTNPRTPQRVTEITGQIAEFHAKAFDVVGQPYWTRESFDDYYYGKGSTYPDIHGSIGILFEQGSSRGLRASTSWGELDYTRCIRNQTIASLSTLEAAVRLQDELRSNRAGFAREAREAMAAEPSAWRIPLTGQRTRAQLFAQLLLMHAIEVRVTQDAYLVPKGQRQHALLASIMEPVTEVPDTSFYDVSAWTLPMAYGLEVTQVRGADAGAGQPVKVLSLDGGLVRDGDARAGWFLGWGRMMAPRALAALHAEGVITRMATQAIDLRGTPRLRIHPGDVFIPAQQPKVSGEELKALIARLAARDHVVFTPVAQGLSARGPDMGSPGHVPIRPTSIALLSGAATSAYRMGEVWHHLDHRLGLEVSVLDADRLGQADLDRYDVIIVPGGRYGGVEQDDREALRDWVRGGGTIVAEGAGSGWLGRAEIASSQHVSGFISAGGSNHAERQSRTALHRLAGAFLEVRLDTTHPLAFGMPERMPVFRVGTHLFDREKRSGIVVGNYGPRPLLSGYASERRQDLMAGKAAVTVERAGSGRIVHFMDQLAFRGTMLGSSRLLANAIFFRSAL